MASARPHLHLVCSGLDSTSSTEQRGPLRACVVGGGPRAACVASPRDLQDAPGPLLECRVGTEWARRGVLVFVLGS